MREVGPWVGWWANAGNVVGVGMHGTGVEGCALVCVVRITVRVCM